MNPPPRVLATDAALALIDLLRARYGRLMFHQSGGCYDGSSPRCFAEGHLLAGDSDRLIGEIGGCPFLVGAAPFERWRHAQLIIDVAAGRGGMLSLESDHGVRFLTRSRIFTDEESAALEASDRR